MADRDIIVVGASAGGLEALVRLVRGLPSGFPASLFVACHTQPGSHSNLPEILSREGPLQVGPDRTTRLLRSARENRHCPAVGPLSSPAARHFGALAIGVILSGTLSDGVAGLMALLHAAAPTRDDARKAPIDERMAVVGRDMARQARDDRHGEVSGFTCPECGGALWQPRRSGPIQFRCHVGHVSNVEVLLTEQGEAPEAAPRIAVRPFREKSVLAHQLAHLKPAEGDPQAALRFLDQAVLAERCGSVIRRDILDGDGAAGTTPRRGPA